MTFDRRARRGGDRDGLCTVIASPELRARIARNREIAAGALEPDAGLPTVVVGAEPRRPGLNDGMIVPGDQFPLGTPLDRVSREAAERAPLTGAVRVIVVLVDFDDRPFEAEHDTSHFERLFFSTGEVPTGSTREFYTEASHGLVDLQGEVVGPYRLPLTIAEYAHGESGVGEAQPNARTMARDALVAANADVDFGPYDNDGNGFVDAFVVVHAGGGAEQTGSNDDIWSHKWVLPGSARTVDGTQAYAYLTVPEDSKVGVCAHELGHLLFGWPDLYDADYTSAGIGDWCLMAGGSWNGGGDMPAHPSAWCKADQQWVSVVAPSADGPLTLADVKDEPHEVVRLWRSGEGGGEYFLVENRQRSRFDAELPGEGLLVWHVDDGMDGNTDEAHYQVALVQADGLRELEGDANQGDTGDPYPGDTANVAFTPTSTPSSAAHSGADTCVAITEIGPAGATMSLTVAVTCPAPGPGPGGAGPGPGPGGAGPDPGE